MRKILFVVLIAVLASCNKGQQQAKTCWKCTINCALGAPPGYPKDTTFCSETVPQFHDNMGNDCGSACVKQ